MLKVVSVEFLGKDRRGCVAELNKEGDGLGITHDNIINIQVETLDTPVPMGDGEGDATVAIHVFYKSDAE